MHGYRQNPRRDNSVASGSEVPAHRRRVAFNLGAIDALAAQYGLEDMAFSSTSEGDQSVDEEFGTYLAQPLASATVNITKWWEVRRSSGRTYSVC